MTQRDAYQLKRRLDLGKPSPGKPQSAQQSQTQVFSTAARPQVPRGDVTHCFYSNRDVINVWDLQAEGYRRGEGTDLVPPTGLLPNGNRCPLRSIPCRPQGPPIYTPSPAQIVPPCTGGTRADRYS